MTNNLKSCMSLFFVILSCLAFQNCPSQAADDEMQEKANVKNKTMCEEEERCLVETGSPIPPIAQGHEEVYRRFLNGVLIYTDPKSGAGMVMLPIRDLTNPLEGTFDLSRCGDTGKYLSISTGYRKKKKAENQDRIEIWICLRSLIAQDINTTATHFKLIMRYWKQEKASVGLFWTWGGWGGLSDYDYLTTQSMDELSNENLYEKWQTCSVRRPWRQTPLCRRPAVGDPVGGLPCFAFALHF